MAKRYIGITKKEFCDKHLLEKLKIFWIRNMRRICIWIRLRIYKMFSSKFSIITLILNNKSAVLQLNSNNRLRTSQLAIITFANHQQSHNGFQQLSPCTRLTSNFKRAKWFQFQRSCRIKSIWNELKKFHIELKPIEETKRQHLDFLRYICKIKK